MSAEQAIGPRAAAGSGAREGVYQLAALGTGGAVIDLSGLKGEYIEIHWLSDSPTKVCDYGFFVDAAAAASFATTDSASSPLTKVAGRDWVDSGMPKPVMVPPDLPFLRVAASTGTGRLCVRSADASRSVAG